MFAIVTGVILYSTPTLFLQLMDSILKDTQVVPLHLTWATTKERVKRTGKTDKMHYEGFWTLVSIDGNTQLLSYYSSQAIEQLNRVLKRLVSSVSYMTPANFKMVVTIFMASQNFLRRKLSDEQNRREVDWLISLIRIYLATHVLYFMKFNLLSSWHAYSRKRINSLHQYVNNIQKHSTSNICRLYQPWTNRPWKIDYSFSSN